MRKKLSCVFLFIIGLLCVSCAASNTEEKQDELNTPATHHASASKTTIVFPLGDFALSVEIEAEGDVRFPQARLTLEAGTRSCAWDAKVDCANRPRE